MRDDITVEEHGLVTLIEINRPPANYFDRRLVGDIADAASEVTANGTRAIVLCSEGRHFCAGADFSGGEMSTDRARASRLLYREAIRLFEIDVPVIAAVQGSAVGGGVGLACATDFRVASPSTRFHVNFSALGFHQGFGLSITLPEIVGPQHAADLLYTSRRVDGRRRWKSASSTGSCRTGSSVVRRSRGRPRSRTPPRWRFGRSSRHCVPH